MTEELANKDRLGKNQIKPLLERYLKTAMEVLNFITAQAREEIKEAVIGKDPLVSGVVTPTGEAAASTPVSAVAVAATESAGAEQEVLALIAQRVCRT